MRVGVSLDRIVYLGEGEGILQLDVVLLDGPQIDYHAGRFEFFRKLEKTVPFGISDKIFSVQFVLLHLLQCCV